MNASLTEGRLSGWPMITEEEQWRALDVRCNGECNLALLTMHRGRRPIRKAAYRAGDGKGNVGPAPANVFKDTLLVAPIRFPQVVATATAPV